MPNRSSHANHIPERSCVICKKKVDRRQLLKFVILHNRIVFDMKGMMQGRGFYVCNDHENLCLEMLEKWLKKRTRKSKRIQQQVL